MAQTGKSKPSYIYAIIGITMVLFLLGTLGWLAINGRGLTRSFKEDIALQVDFHDNTRDEHIQKMKEIMDNQPFVKSVNVISKEEALSIQSNIEGVDLDQFLGYNPLFASLEVKTA
jgi:cell division transport system permease protein